MINLFRLVFVLGGLLLILGSLLKMAVATHGNDEKSVTEVFNEVKSWIKSKFNKDSIELQVNLANDLAIFRPGYYSPNETDISFQMERNFNYFEAQQERNRLREIARQGQAQMGANSLAMQQLRASTSVVELRSLLGIQNEIPAPIQNQFNNTVQDQGIYHYDGRNYIRFNNESEVEIYLNELVKPKKPKIKIEKEEDFYKWLAGDRT